MCDKNSKLKSDGTCTPLEVDCEKDESRVEKCSTLSKCFNPLTSQYDNSECKSKKEACARWTDGNNKEITGCIGSSYCGTSALFKGVMRKFMCPNGSEKQGIANSASVIPATLYEEKNLKNCEFTSMESYNSKSTNHNFFQFLSTYFTNDSNLL